MYYTNRASTVMPVLLPQLLEVLLHKHRGMSFFRSWGAPTSTHGVHLPDSFMHDDEWGFIAVLGRSNLEYTLTFLPRGRAMDRAFVIADSSIRRARVLPPLYRRLRRSGT